MDQVILYGSIFSPLIPLFASVFKRRRLNRSFIILTTLIALSFIAELVMLFLALGAQNNLFVSHFFGLVEGLLLIAFFRDVLRVSKSRYYYLLVGYAIVYSLISAFFEDFLEFNMYSRSFEALLMIVLAVCSFYAFYMREEDIFIEKSPEFWIVIAVMIYFSGALFSFLLSSDMLAESSGRFYGSWIIHNVSNFAQHVLFTVAIWRIKV